MFLALILVPIIGIFITGGFGETGIPLSML